MALKRSVQPSKCEDGGENSSWMSAKMPTLTLIEISLSLRDPKTMWGKILNILTHIKLFVWYIHGMQCKRRLVRLASCFGG